MKLVINKCYGGFSLSTAAIIRYAELDGWTPTFWKSEYCGDGKSKFHRIDPPTGRALMVHVSKDENPPYAESGGAADGHWYDRDLKRSDPILVRVVEELGDEASGDCAELRVVEIPDDVEDYTIEDYDGIEWVAESHRTWR